MPGLGVARSVWSGLNRVAGGARAPADRGPSPRVDYVEYGSLMTPPAPFRSLDTQLFGFWAEVDEERVSSLCHKVFAEPSHGTVRCRQIGRHVMITWGVIDRVLSEIPEFASRGAVTEPQVAVWIPVGIRDPTAQRERFAMFIPYIWLDNPMSLATGRELFGYPKSWGWPQLPSAERPRTWTLDVFGLNYGPHARAARYPLLEVAEGDSLEGAAAADIGALSDLARDTAGRLFEGGLELSASLLGDIVQERMPGVFLKQFRDVRDGLGAALQQIVETRYEVVRLRAEPLLHEYELTVHRLDSHPVIDELGLQSQTLALGYHVEMDFNVGGGQVLWDAALR